MKKQNMFQIALLAMALFMSMAAMAQSKIYYVSPTGTGNGSSWTNATTLTTALNNAKAGDQIWVQGFEQIDNSNKLYIAPATGFTLKSGVQLYGGFKGDETTLDARETLGKPYQLRYRTVLSGAQYCREIYQGMTPLTTPTLSSLPIRPVRTTPRTCCPLIWNPRRITATTTIIPPW